MSRIPRFLAAFVGLVLALPFLGASPSQASASVRSRVNFDSGWRFSLGHAYDASKDFDHGTAYFSYLAKAGNGDGPAAPKFDDRAWRQLDLPHDWAVEVPFTGAGSHSHGYKAIGRRFPENSVGWYRKTFTVPASDLGQRISVEFDGVYRDSVVWINGFYLGRQPSGTTGFRYDLTDYLNYGGENVLSVRADATMEEGWYYEGAGIYRHVWLTRTAPVHVPQWGVFVWTEVDGDVAKVNVQTKVANALPGQQAARVDVETSIVDDTGVQAGIAEWRAIDVGAGATALAQQQLLVSKPRLWSLELPHLYRAVTTLRRDGVVLDRVETRFGIRTIRFDANKGFFLNGKHVVIKGTNNHQDHAGVGVAVPDALLEYRIRKLKEFGNNAYRCSHNPPAPELLEICDRLGMLVLDETRLMGPSPEQLSQLEAMMLRDRNSPSVILWGLGNEEWKIEGNEFGARISASMRAFAERIDPTRRTVVAISGGWGAGSSTTTDVMGYNYYTHGSTDEQHAKFPEQPSVGTEETTAQCTRGVYFTDKAKAHQAHLPDHIGDSGGNTIAGWKHYAARPYLAGLFYWTGFDYRGESNPYPFPAISSQYGILDTCGFPKDSYWYLKSVWTDEPVLHLWPHWNWAGREGQAITVGCYTNHEEVELFLNGRSLGRKAVPHLDRVEWSVPYEAGVLEVRGFRKGAEAGRKRVETTGAPTHLTLEADRTVLAADGVDTTVFTVRAMDAQGREVPTAGNLARFSLEGGKIIGVGNGDPSCHEADVFVAGNVALPVTGWRGRIAAAGTTAPQAGAEHRPFQLIGDWKAPLPQEGECYELAADLKVEALPENAALDLFLPCFGVRTSVWLNGEQVLADADTGTAGPAIRIPAGKLPAGLHRLTLIVAPADGQARRLPQLDSLGCLRVETPAPRPQRSLFNGLAQVIVQATRKPGSIVLRAEAEGLSPAEVTIEAR